MSKGDITRDTFRPRKHYSSVRMQQGRVPMDADYNENEDIHRHLERTETIDVIGASGMPAAESGFAITFVNGRFRIGPGRGYVDGILVENAARVDFVEQPDFPGQADPLEGAHFFYLDVWEEHVTALEDPYIREVALNGPDTATRLRVVWQVRELDAGAAPNCEAAFALIPGPTNATLRARARTPDDTEACTVKPGSSYKRLENQLYRVEVHAGGGLGSATFKWSRDNATVASGVQIAAARILTVDSIGRDQMLSFASGQWIEITDRYMELRGQTGVLFKIARVEGNNLILDDAGPAVESESYGAGLKARRWDSDGAVRFEHLDADGYMALEDGVQVRLAGNDFRPGDYWLIPARTAIGDVEWSTTGGVPDALPPHGIKHHYCPLALAGKLTLSFPQALTTTQGATMRQSLTIPELESNPQWFEELPEWWITDCRELFVSLTDVIAMSYVAGDGQTVTPNPLNPGAFLELVHRPTVGVSRGKIPVSGAIVRFTMEPPAGRFTRVVPPAGPIPTSTLIATDAKGLAECFWMLSPMVAVQKLRAELLDDTGKPIHLPIIFKATLNTADKVAYTPTPACPELAGKVTVQAALDELCKRHPAKACCKSVGEGGDYPDLKAALDDLLKQRISGFCLCLLPGDHPWPPDADAQLANPPMPPISVTLGGVPGVSRIVANSGLHFTNLSVLAMSDLILTVKGGVSFNGVKQIDLQNLFMTMEGNVDAMLVADATSFTLASSSLSSTSFQTAPAAIRLMRLGVANVTENMVSRTVTFVGTPIPDASPGSRTIGGTATPGITPSTGGGIPPGTAGTLAPTSTPGAALVLEDGAGTYHVRDNVFRGFVSLYGTAASERMRQQDALSIPTRLREGPPTWGAGSLYFSNNDVGALVLAKPFTDPAQIVTTLAQSYTASRKVFQNGYVSGNTIHSLPIEVLFTSAVFSGNVMTSPPRSFLPLVVNTVVATVRGSGLYGGVVVAYRATYTGNIATDIDFEIVSAVPQGQGSQAANSGVAFV